jgi:hypothetical protein
LTSARLYHHYNVKGGGIWNSNIHSFNTREFRTWLRNL